jgi:hypothetical protein
MLAQAGWTLRLHNCLSHDAFGCWGFFMHRILMMATLASAIFVVADNSFGASLMGTGAMRCGEWTRLRTFSDSQTGHIKELTSLHQVEAWVDGFVSGVNAAGADGGWSDFLSSKPKTDALYGMVDSYCRRNGIDNVADAAADTVKELKKQAQR